MPYIIEDRRVALDNHHDWANTPGELNYQITDLVFRYFQEHRNYQGINDVLGALEGAKLEFYRRVAAPYEDKKIQENGDVYE